jgi:NADPH:quinone reductase-like Zn-dependent oxidoreductase
LRAAVRDRYGGPDVVRVEEVETPAPTGDEVLVRVHAASVNRADLDGLYPMPSFVRLMTGIRRPRFPGVGIDVAGRIEAVGPDVTRFSAGDDVFTDLYTHRPGAFAEYVCAPERSFQRIAAGMSYEVAATLPHSAVLAVQGLRLRRGRTVRPGDRVLIDGAAGNVGPFAIQIAKSMGAEVTGVDGAEKLDLVRSVGADHAVDYRTVDYTRAQERYDWILAVSAFHPIQAVRRALRPDGVYIVLGGTGGDIARAMAIGGLISLGSRRSMGLMLWWKPFAADDVETLKALVATGKVTPVIDRRYPLGEVVEALRYVDDGHARGKVLVIPA